MTKDRDILKGFMAGESAACAELLTRLRPAVLTKLRLHHGGLRHAHDEILDAAETRLFEWRKETLAGGGQIDLDERIKDLAWRLAKQEAESEGRYQERNPLAPKSSKKSRQESSEESSEDSSDERSEESRVEWEQASELHADERVNLGALEQEIDGLPEEMALVLMAEAQRVLAGAAPLQEQLGITPEAARKRMERARKELKERLRQGSEGE